MFDTLESTQILLRGLVRQSCCQVLLMNYPGQAFTTFRDGGSEPDAGVVLNNDYFADCLAELLEVGSVAVVSSPLLSSRRALYCPVVL
jgi:hypothetical protein